MKKFASRQIILDKIILDNGMRSNRSDKKRGDRRIPAVLFAKNARIAGI